MEEKKEIVVTIPKMDEMEMRVRKALLDLGLSPQYAGFKLLVTAVQWQIQDDTTTEQVIKMYEDIAKKFNITYTQVERNMRNTVEKAYNVYEIRKYWGTLFGIGIFRGGETRPTNSTFISYVAEYIKLGKLGKGIY